MLGEVIIPIVTFLIFRLGGYFTQQGMAWYAVLIRPTITPPGWVFSVAWTVIYMCAMACALIVWRTFVRDWRFYSIMSLFVLNACLNVLWTYLFFTNHLALYALIDAMALLATTWALIILVIPTSLVCAGLLLPYGLWLFLAVYLNWQFMMINAL